MRVRDLLLALPLLILLAGHPGAAKDPTPLPTPTDTSGLPTETLQARATVPHPEGLPLESAREAAFLTALGRLALQAAPEGTDSSFRVDAAHPRYELLGWLLGSQVREPSSPRGLLEIHLESPPLHSMDPVPGSPGLVLDSDLDGDGALERITVGPDTRLDIHRGDLLIARSEPLGFLEVRSLPGPRGLLEMVRLTRPLAVEGGEPDGSGRARLQVRLLHSEALGGRCAGRFEEVREIHLPLKPPDQSPSIEVTSPQPEGARVPLRGLVRAPQGLARVQVHLNEAELWRSPPGLKGEQVKLDLVLELRPGRNLVRLAVTDQEGLRATRTLILSGPPRRTPGQGLAVVVGLPEASAEARSVGEALTGAGFSVDSRLGPKATREAILQALEELSRQVRPGDRVVLYYAGESSLDGSPSEKVLATADGGRIGVSDLAGWARGLGGARLLILLDTRTPTADPGPLGWNEGNAFLEGLTGPDRLLLASGDAPTHGDLGRAFLAALKEDPDPFRAARRAYPQVVQNAAGQPGEPGWPLLRED